MPDLIFNRNLQAYNVFEFDIEYDKVHELVSPVLKELNQASLYHPTKSTLHIKDMTLPMFVQIPKWNGDISWISAASKESFEFFDSCFEKLQIERKTQNCAGLDIPLIMYSGFFVARSYVTAPYYHQDYSENCGNKAYTMMTPVQMDESATSGHLLYKNTTQSESIYRYEKGRAITFGTNFTHSTEPFESKTKYIFLCFTYGCKDMTYWKDIKTTVTQQGVSYRHPNGNIVVKKKYQPYF